MHIKIFGRLAYWVAVAATERKGRPYAVRVSNALCHIACISKFIIG